MGIMASSSSSFDEQWVMSMGDGHGFVFFF
jgi:hypothetical protein